MGRAIKKVKPSRNGTRVARTTRSPRATRQGKAGRAAGLLTRAEVVNAVVELANKLAPADVGDLLVAE